MVKNVSAVIVLYKPDIPKVIVLIEMLKSLEIRCYIVDNTPSVETLTNSVLNWRSDYIPLGKNEGIAKAQNIGIRKAIQNSAAIIILLDQDSVPSEMCLQMQINNVAENDSDISVPTIVDRKEGFEYVSNCVNSVGLLRARPRGIHEKPFEVDVSISSGSVISVDVFHKVGYFEESLFIDFVDIEWYFRCRSKRVLVKSDPRAVMIHSIGEKSIKKFGFRSIVHSSQRNYFKIRNPFRLVKIKTVPKMYAFKEIFSAPCHLFLQIPFSVSPLNHIKHSLLGLKDGLAILFSK